MKKILFSLFFLLWLLIWGACSDSHYYPLLQSQLKAVFVNGDSLHYIDVGKGAPVVFVHGSLGDYRTWRAQIAMFAKKYRVIAYSRRFAYPNNQVINDWADYTVVAHSEDLAAFIKALHLGPVHLIGHSYGAFTALLTTMDHPELVRSLTLGEPPIVSLLQQVPGGDTLLNNFITKVIIPVAGSFKNNDINKAVKLFINGAWGDSSYFSKFSQQDRTIMMDNTLELGGAVCTNNLFPPITCNDIRKIKTPVLLLKGDRSPLFSTSIINELDRCLDNKENAILSNSSHGLEFENPLEFNQIVLAFINKL